MPNITYIDPEGNSHSAEVEVGQTLMQAAVDNMIPGIQAECGGSCACATCQVIVDSVAEALIPPAEHLELSMIEAVNEENEDNHRLSCQIQATEDMDGMVLRIPESQY